jgi:heavy metal sensor kinase
MFSRLSIRIRLTAWYALSLALLLSGLAISSYFVMRASIYRAVDVDLQYRIESVEDELSESQPIASIDALPEVISRWDTLDVLFQILDENGRMIYQSPVLLEHRVHPIPSPPLDKIIVYQDSGTLRWPVRMAAQRSKLAGQTIIIEVAQPLRFHYASLREFATSLLIFIPLLVVIAGLGGYWLSGRALAPVHQIVEEARAIDSSRLSQRLTVPVAQDELRRLSETLNSMLDRIEVSMTRIKQFTADASHELRGPATLIQTAAEYSLRRERSREELTEAMETILRESQRTSQLVENLLLLARADSGDAVTLGSVRLDIAVREAAERLKQFAASKNIRITENLDGGTFYVTSDPTLMQRMLFILIENAVKYTPENGSVTLDLRASGNDVIVGVTDTGIGIAPEDLPRVFDRFWRADKVRSREMGGTGLGLSIAKSIVEKSGGTIHVESVVGQGSRFEVRLPRSQGSLKALQQTLKISTLIL